MGIDFGGLQTIQKILVYMQIVDSYVKLALDVCLVIGVIILIRYFKQKTLIEKADHQTKMREEELKKIVDDMNPKTIEEQMENMDI